MTLEEFKEKGKNDEEWAPGWEAIDSVFDTLYPQQEPAHFATNMVSRAVFGGNNFLDGYSVYTSPNGYKHIVTYGMTVLYYDEEAFGKEWNGWGYEMTIKLAEKEDANCRWALNMLGNLAEYTYKTNNFFEPYQYFEGVKTISLDRPSEIVAFITVPDTEAAGLDTVYGRTDFIQLVGITERELALIKEAYENLERLVKEMKKDNPLLITDLNRVKSYL